MSDSANLYKEVYQGIGANGSISTSLPEQAIPSYRKTPKWWEKNMDRLEEIGLQQIRKNLIFDEYYRMVEGDLAYTDYEETPEILKYVADLRQQADIPSYVRHFDIIGQVTKYLSGKYNDTKAKFRVDFFQDEIATNEYDREINNRIFQFTQQLFEIEMQTRLLRNGVQLQDKFKSKEEEQQYLKYLEQEKAKLDTPPQIKTAMDTKWKPAAAKWAERTVERDRVRHNLNELEREFFKDFFLTGRYFKHYRISYDYYEPERWHPIETFFSEDATAKYPQDGEYVGNIQEMSPSEAVDKFGHLMKEKDQKKLLNHYQYEGGQTNETDKKPSFETIMKSNFQDGVAELLPHEDYYDRQSTVELQSALGQPLGQTTYVNSQGEEQTVDSFVPNYEFNNTGLVNVSRLLRRDIDVRQDTIRVTQAYWRSWERIGLLYYETDAGIPATEWVTDEILDEFIQEKEIKKLTNMSLVEFEQEYNAGTIEPNSIVFTYAPRCYKGIKLSGTNSILKKDLYLGMEPMPLQIKGNSNIYDIKLPVTGIITSSEAKKIRPFQIEYNYQMNLMHSLTEKEIGVFWLFDISLLPSDFDGLGDAKETLLNVLDMARDTGLVPLDMSKQNMKDRVGQQFNSMMAQDISFVPQIQQKMQLADYYKSLALEQIGITNQDMKTPSEYSTAEGIKVGQSNTFAQIEHIFEKMDNARLKDLETGLAVAQFCEVNDKEISTAFMRSDEEQMLIREVFADENFHLRKFGLLPIADAKKRKELENFKQYLLSSNSISNDLSDISEVITSDSFQTVNKILKDSYKERVQQQQAEGERLERIEQMKIEGEQQKTQAERDYQMLKQDKELQARKEIAHIQAAASVRDRNQDEGDIEAVNKVAEMYTKTEQENRKIDLQEESMKQKGQEAMTKLKLEMQKLALKKEDQRLKEKAIDAKTTGDIINKN